MQTFTVILRNETFHLTAKQVTLEKKSVFNKHFFNDDGSRKEAAPPLVLEGDPVLFQTIARYLDGYHVFTTFPVVIRDQLTYGCRLDDLGRDCRTYRLPILNKMVDSERKRFTRILHSQTRKYAFASAVWVKRPVEYMRVLSFSSLKC